MCKRKTHDEFIQEVFYSVGDVYIYLSKYETKRIKVDVIHKKCGERLSMLPSSIIKGACSHCAKNKNKYSIEYVNEFLKERNLKLISKKYSSCKEKLEIKCECGDIFLSSFDVIKNGKRDKCYKCSPITTFKKGITPVNKKDTETFKQDVSKISDEYEVMSEYLGSHINVEILHKKCNRIWSVKPTHFLSRNGGCKFCSESKGERLSRFFLENNKIDFESQKYFKKCFHKKVLKYDFILSNRILIEIDGEGHFNPFRFKNDVNKNITNLKHTQLRDKIKNQYCIDNNIPLVRIPYKQQENIDYILHNVLIHFGLIENKQDTYDKDIVLKYLVDKNWDHEKYIEENKAS